MLQPNGYVVILGDNLTRRIKRIDSNIIVFDNNSGEYVDHIQRLISTGLAFYYKPRPFPVGSTLEWDSSPGNVWRIDQYVNDFVATIRNISTGQSLSYDLIGAVKTLHPRQGESKLTLKSPYKRNLPAWW